MDKIIQSVGVLLLLGVLFLSVLTYSNVFGVGDSIKVIKDRVVALFDWFIPKTSNISFTVATGFNYTLTGNKLIVNAPLSAGTNYKDLVLITVKTDKEATLLLRVSSTLANNTALITYTTNNVILEGVPSAYINPGATTVLKHTLYPTSDSATVVISLSINAAKPDSGTITIEVVLSYLK